ncbi:MAG: hypothetical protein ACLPX1_19095 [Steroidobacteraceae bacterium]
MTLAAKSSRYCFAVNDANSGSSANAKKISAGSATSRLGRNRSALFAAASAVPVISTSLCRKQAGRPYVEHDRHQQVDRHRRDRQTRHGGQGGLANASGINRADRRASKERPYFPEFWEKRALKRGFQVSNARRPA